MPTSSIAPLSGTINSVKSARPGYAPLLLCTITLIDGTTLYLSTSYNNSSLLTLDYGGQHYLCRVLDQSISSIQVRSQTGIDLIPSATISITDADRFLLTNYHLPPNAGFRGAILQLTLIYHQIGTTNFTTDSSTRFTGILQKPYWDDDVLTLSAYSLKNPQNIFLPTARVTALCQNTFPANLAQRIAGQPQSATDSWYWGCGYSPDVSGGDSRGNLNGSTPFTTCNLTVSDCQARGMYAKDSSNRITARFSGSQWNPPLSFSSVSYTSGSVVKGYNSSNNAKFGQRYPLVIGTGWVEPIILNTVNDGNSQRGECGVCTGNVGSGIIQVLCNDNTLPRNTGHPADVLFRWDQVTSGDRSGHANTDAGYTDRSGNPLGDPHGGVATIEYVVPNQLVSSQSTPRIRVLLTGPGIRYYTSPTSYSIVQYDPIRPLTPSTGETQDGGVNPAWGIMELLINGNFEYSDLDIPSFIAAAAVCDVQIPHTDITGDVYQHCRYSFSLILPGTNNARDLGSILQNCLRSFNASLNPNPLTGKIQLYIRQTLGDQQPSPITGSNYSTSIPSTTGAGTSKSGYIAWHFTGANVIFEGQPPNLKPTIKQLPPLGSDIATTVSIPFQDAENQWVDDSYTVIDTQALPFTAQQQISSNNFQQESATTFDQIGRTTRTYFYEQTRGNFSEDPRGTDVYQLKTTSETNHLVVGSLCWLTYLRDGVYQQLFRVSKISYSKDARIITYELTFHDDNWYQDDNTNLIPPAYSDPGLTIDQSSVLPWHPGGIRTQTTSGLPYRIGVSGFDISLIYTGPDLNGNYNPSLTIYGYPPVNTFSSSVQPPMVPLYATTSSTGGQIQPGDYVFCLCTLDCTDPSKPLTSSVSNLIHVTVPAGSNNNTITISRIYWRPSTVPNGYTLYGGTEEHTLYVCGTDNSSTPSSITIVAIPTNSYGPPDRNFSRFRIQAKLALHLGVWALSVISYNISTGVITFLLSGDPQTFVSNKYVGYLITRLCSGSDISSPPLYEPVGSWFVSSNDGLTVTIDRDTYASTIKPGDILVMRAQCSVYSSTTIGDPNFLNTVYPTGQDETGNEVWIIYGTGAGQRRTISSNDQGTTGTYTVAKQWDTIPASDSVFIIVYPGFPYDQVTSTFSISGNISDPDTGLPPFITTVDFTNYLNQQIILRVITENAQGVSGIDSMAPFREFFIQGLLSPSASGGDGSDPGYVNVIKDSQDNYQIDRSLGQNFRILLDDSGTIPFTNSDFETGDLTNWAQGTSTLATATSATTFDPSSVYSAKIPVTSTLNYIYQTITGLVSGKTYTIWAWVAGDMSGTATASITVKDSTGANQADSPIITPSPTWQILAVSFTATSTHDVVIVLNRQANLSGSVYFDNVVLAANTILAPIFTGGTINGGVSFTLYVDQPLSSSTTPPLTAGFLVPYFEGGTGGFTIDFNLPAQRIDTTLNTRTTYIITYHGTVWGLDSWRTGGSVS